MRKSILQVVKGEFMKLIIMTAILLASSLSFADIPMPNRDTDTPARAEIDGPAAMALYESINTDVIRGSALRTGYSTYKVQRANDGLNQVVCEKFVSRLMNRESSAYCTTETSKDGKKLKPFKPAIRMG